MSFIGDLSHPQTSGTSKKLTLSKTEVRVIWRAREPNRLVKWPVWRQPGPDSAWERKELVHPNAFCSLPHVSLQLNWNPLTKCLRNTNFWSKANQRKSVLECESGDGPSPCFFRELLLSWRKSALHWQNNNSASDISGDDSLLYIIRDLESTVSVFQMNKSHQRSIYPHSCRKGRWVWAGTPVTCLQYMISLLCMPTITRRQWDVGPVTEESLFPHLKNRETIGLESTISID